MGRANLPNKSRASEINAPHFSCDLLFFNDNILVTNLVLHFVTRIKHKGCEKYLIYTAQEEYKYPALLHLTSKMCELE